jgi:hypothetical protein
MKTVFNYNTPVTAEWFNIINGTRLRFDGDPTNPSGMVDGQYLPIRDIDITSGNSTLSNVLANDLVKTAGNQTIAGVKTFTSPIKIPAAIGLTDAVNLADVSSRLSTLETALSSLITTLDSDAVKKTGNQVINGFKQFTSPVRIANGVQVSDAVTLAQLQAVSNSVSSNLYGTNHIEFPNGLKILFGTQTGGGGQVQTFSLFALPFNNPPYVVATPIEPDATVMFSVSEITTNSYKVWGRKLNTNNISLNHNFIAIGF